jgi:DNA-binding XRE family transcriptional regulator
MYEDYGTIEEVIATLSPESKLWVEQESARLIAEYETLQSIRKQRMITQKQLAEKLNVHQVSVSKVENSSDMMLSTLKAYVHALGGELKLQINFPDKKNIALKLEGLGD